MADTVIIDHDILGWGNSQLNELEKLYKKILKVGVDPELLSQRSIFQASGVFPKTWTSRYLMKLVLRILRRALQRKYQR